jgi:hypothetical protein
MAIAVTFDERPHTLGDLMVVTGQFTISGGVSTGDIDVGAFMSEVLGATVTATDTTSVSLIHVGGTTVVAPHMSGNDKSGHFMVLGKR